MKLRKLPKGGGQFPKRILGVVAMMAGLALPGRGELLYEGFDTLETGQVAANLPGWGLYRSNDEAGAAHTNHVFQGSRTLDLPYVGSLTGDKWTSAAYTNFNCVYAATSHPVIRMSAMLYRENNNQSVTLGIGRGTNLVVWVGSDALRNAIVVNNHTTGVNFVTGRYASIHPLYDMAENKAALEYDGVNVMPWQAVGSSVCTQFNLFAVRRFTPLADLSARGDVAVDLAVVETFPPKTRAWFRFEDEGHYRLTDQTGSFLPGELYFTGRFEPGPWSGLRLPNGTAHNRNARRNFCAYGASMAKTILGLADWTLEFLVRIAPAQLADNTPIFMVDRPGSPLTGTNTWISVIWVTNQTLSLALRMNNCQFTGLHHSVPDAAQLPADDRWHHIALVRNGGALQVYQDYELYNHINLQPGISDGDYNLTPEHFIEMGHIEFTTNSCLDEVRLTDRILDPAEFLAPPLPVAAKEFRLVGTNAQMRVEQVDHRGYRVQINTNLLAGGSWTNWYT